MGIEVQGSDDAKHRWLDCGERSPGGLITKIHALVEDANGLPDAPKLTTRQVHGGRSAVDMVGTLGPGYILLADRAYDNDALRKA